MALLSHRLEKRDVFFMILSYFLVNLSQRSDCGFLNETFFLIDFDVLVVLKLTFSASQFFLSFVPLI